MSSARAVIIDHKKILLMHRFANNKEYYVLPGGHIEPQERPEETLVRELKEETNFDVVINKKLWELTDPTDDSIHHIFLIKTFTGVMQLKGPEAERNSKSNRYILEWHDLNKLASLNLISEKTKELIIEKLS